MSDERGFVRTKAGKCDENVNEQWEWVMVKISWEWRVIERVMIRVPSQQRLARWKLLIDCEFLIGVGGSNNDKGLDQVTRKNYINFSEDFWPLATKRHSLRHLWCEHHKNNSITYLKTIPTGKEWSFCCRILEICTERIIAWKSRHRNSQIEISWGSTVKS